MRMDLPDFEDPSRALPTDFRGLRKDVRVVREPIVHAVDLQSIAERRPCNHPGK